MIQGTSLCSQLLQWTPQKVLAHKPQHTFTQQNSGVEYDSCALPRQRKGWKKRISPAFKFCIDPDTWTHWCWGWETKKKRRKRDREMREGPHLLCKLDSSCCFVHADTSSCSPGSELRRPEHKSQGRGGSWLRASLPHPWDPLLWSPFL